MTKIVAIVIFISCFFLNKAYSEDCFLYIEKAATINPKIISTLGISLISQYIEELESIPISGIGKHDCVYKVAVTESKSGIFVTISGRGMHAYGDSKLGGVDGLQQALLRSIYRANLDKKDEICEAYNTILAEDCSKVVASRHPNSSNTHVPRANSVQEQQFLFEPLECKNQETNLTCSILVTNISSDKKLEIENGSRAFDNLGNEYVLKNYTGRLQIANKSEQWGFGRLFVSGVPVKVSVTFFKSNPDATSIALLEYRLKYNKESFSIKFRNIPIDR